MEVWKSINDYTNYKISSLGRIKSTKTKERYLKNISGRNNYLQVSLSEKAKSQNYLIHRLVALYFVPNPSGHAKVKHVNGNKLDNSAYNLIWISTGDYLKQSS